MHFGDILCLKTTGELCFILRVYEAEGQRTTVDVRRPVMGREGITHMTDSFFAEELETAEQHLRHEANEMVLKLDIQQEIMAKREEEASKVSEKEPNLQVN